MKKGASSMKLFAVGRKKADLSLSINSIVILILAITVMGLGLTFIRGLFKGATEKLGGALEQAELKNPPSSEKPMTIDSRIALLINEKKTIQIGVYNPDSDKIWENVKPKIKSCVDSGNTPRTGFSIATPVQTIGPREIKGYSAILTASVNATDTYICTIDLDATGGNIHSSQSFGTISASSFIEVK